MWLFVSILLIGGVVGWLWHKRKINVQKQERHSENIEKLEKELIPRIQDNPGYMLAMQPRASLVLDKSDAETATFMQGIYNKVEAELYQVLYHTKHINSWNSPQQFRLLSIGVVTFVVVITNIDEIEAHDVARYLEKQVAIDRVDVLSPDNAMGFLQRWELK